MDKDNTIQHPDKENQGYISLHRKIFDNKYYFSGPFTRSSAWIDLLLLANYSDSYFFIRGMNVHVRRGQLAYSQVTLARRWRWSIGKVVRYFYDLKMSGQIDYQNTNVTTLITILNYDQYQKTGEQISGQTESKRKANERHKNKDNKDNKYKGEKFIPPTLEMVQEYFKANGYTVEAAEKAFRYYSAAGWKDKKGDQVKNWKQKMIAVWFRDEYKIQVETTKKLPYVIPQN